MNDVDIAFRLGVEQGMQQAQQQQALDAEAKANESEMRLKEASMGGANGDPNKLPGEEGPNDGTPKEDIAGEPDNQPAGMNGTVQPGQEAQNSELDQHIGKLEGMLGNESNPEIQKSIQAIVSLHKAERQSRELKKSQAAIAGIAKALHKPSFKLGVQASANLNDDAKKAVSMQHKIVNDIMKAWGSEEQKAHNSIESILNIEGLLKE
jgi:hypothetical protein